MFGSAWRNFKFFESIGLNEPPLVPPSIEIVSCCVSHAHLFVGDCAGRIHMIDRTANARTGGHGTGSSSGVLSFQAYTGAITHMKYIRSRNLLATLGDDDALNTTILRLWQVDQCVQLCQGNVPSADGVLWRPPSREHRLFTAKYPAPSAGAGAVLVKVNQNEERIRSLRLNAGAGAGNRRGPSDATDGIPASSLLSVVVAFAVSEDAQHCAVALTSGECVVLHGDLEKDRVVRTRRIRSGIATGRVLFVGFPSKAKVCIPSVAAASKATPAAAATTRKSTSLFGGAQRVDDAMQVMFTVYDNIATVWAISPTGDYTEYPCYEGNRLAAAAPGCACLSPDGHLVVCAAGDGSLAILGPKPKEGVEDRNADTRRPAPEDATAASSFYDPTGNTSGDLQPCVTALSLADDGSAGNKRNALLWHAGYMVLLSESPNRPEHFQLQCYDPVHRIRALSRAQEQHTDVAFVLTDGAGELLVLTQQPAHKTQLAYSALGLREIDTLSKLDLLFSKECYGIAKSIADHQAHGVDPSLHRLIEKRYADYLYSKGKYTEAMDEYIACIGSLEPSYVISRYMQSQHVEELTRYLEALHQRKHGYVAHVSHTTLLLNCYIRLNREDKLLAFVRRDDIRFDAPNAIAVCRQGGQYEAALVIADKYSQVYERASILIHDLHRPKEALEYIGTLGVDDAEDILKKAGKQLIAWEPLRTTDALLQLCVRWRGPARRLPTDVQDQRSRKPAKRAEAKDFLHVFVDSPVCLLNFLRGIVASGVLESDYDTVEQQQESGALAFSGGGGIQESDFDEDEIANRRAVYNTLFELYITKELRQSIRVLGDEGEDGSSDDPASAEAVAAKEGGNGGAGRGHDDAASEAFPVEPLPRRQEQAMTFLEACHGRYDDYVALSLCHQHQFEAGTLFLLRKMHLSADLINFYGDRMTSAKTATARREAQTQLLQEVERLDQQLQEEKGQEAAASDAARKSAWMTLLALLVRSAGTEWQDVVTVLDRIEAHDILSPTVVMEILCSPESTLQLRTVRGYCQRALVKQFSRMQAAQAQTAAHLRRIEELKEEITGLQTEAVVFPCAQCAHCGQPLDFPAVHFMCRHSFHQRCLNVSTQCNLCAAQHRKVFEAAKERLESVQSSEGVDRFFQRLAQPDSRAVQGSGGGFDVIADYIARGALGPASATSVALGQPLSRRPEASLFAPDPAIRAQRGGDVGQEVYDANGDVMDAETVEWW